MKLFGGLAALTASAAALDPTEWLKTKYQATQLQGVNSQILNNALSLADQKEVLLNLNQNSPQMGMSPLNMLLTGGASGLNKQDILGNMKDNLKNQMYSKFQSTSLNPLLLQYAKAGGTGNNNVHLSKEHILYSQMPDPMGTILRMKKSSNAAVKERGNLLMKKMVARLVKFSCSNVNNSLSQ